MRTRSIDIRRGATTGSSFCFSIFFEFVCMESSLKHLGIPPDYSGLAFFPPFNHIEALLYVSTSFHFDSKNL